MALERPPSAIWFVLRIKMQHYSCDFAPVGTFRIRVEQAQIRDDVLLVVDGQYRIGGRGISDIRIKRRLLHVCASRTRLLIEKSPLGSWHIDDARSGEVRFTLKNRRRQFEPSGPKSAIGLNRSRGRALRRAAWPVPANGWNDGASYLTMRGQKQGRRTDDRSAW